MKALCLLLISMVLSSATCENSKNHNDNTGCFSKDFYLKYSLDKPTAVFEMPPSLIEISGLTYSDRKNILYTINDEKGIIYGIDPLNGNVIDKIDFGRPDDYEGIAYCNGMIYIAESNGNIKVVNEKLSERHAAYKSLLSKDNNIEGAVYDPVSKSILLAAKGNSKIEGDEKMKKSIFSMHITDGKVDDQPYISLNVKDAAEKFQKQDIEDSPIGNARSTYRIKQFAPSGIAIHPKTNNLYLLSARGNLLLVTNKEAELLALVLLDQSLHVQPEGICFAPDGTLFIANEGRRESNGKLYSYAMDK